MPLRTRAALVTLLLFTTLIHAKSTHFGQCLLDIRNITSPTRLSGVVYNNGTSVVDLPMPGCSDEHPYCGATAVDYPTCKEQCGASQEPFKWSIFSQQFSAWLLPWLALLSQLPFGALHRIDNLMSVVLAIGSPTLAAYSVVLTVLNSSWLARRFTAIGYPNAGLAARALSSLQQSPLKITSDYGLLSSLVVLHHNDEWWDELIHWLHYTHTWSISAVTNLLWVVIAYVFTVINAFTTIDEDIKSQGQAVGSLWLWLPPIVVGWLQISPKCDWDRLVKAMERANGKAHVATDDGVVVDVGSISARLRAFSFHREDRGPLYDDQQCSAPIYNYARVFTWAQSAEKVASAFEAASDNASDHLPVAHTTKAWRTPDVRGVAVHAANREGTLREVEAYCRSKKGPASPWGPNVWLRIGVASLVALGLQWATAGSAVVIAWHTPTVGLGCRSGTYLSYGVVSTVTWLIMLLSSILTHYATIPSRVPPDIELELVSSASVSGQSSGEKTLSHAPPQPTHAAAAALALLLRRTGKLLAIANAVWVLAASVFQFTNFFNRCWCNTNVIGLGLRRAYTVMELMPEDVEHVRAAWTGGVVMSTVAAAGFVFWVNVWINPPLPG